MPEDLAGKTLAGYLVLSREGSNSGGQALWKCKGPQGQEVLRTGVYLRGLSKPRQLERRTWTSMWARCKGHPLDRIQGLKAWVLKFGPGAIFRLVWGRIPV